MPIMLGSRKFLGPLVSGQTIPNCAGIYAIMYKDNFGLAIIKIAETLDLGQTVAALSKAKNIVMAVLPVRDQSTRQAILKSLLQEYGHKEEAHVPAVRTTMTGAGLSF